MNKNLESFIYSKGDRENKDDTFDNDIIINNKLYFFQFQLGLF